MTNPKIIPQKFLFEKPTITNGCGKVISHGITVTIPRLIFQCRNKYYESETLSIIITILSQKGETKL